MDLNDTPEQAAYRASIRAWLEENKQHAPKNDAGQTAARRAWQRRLAEAKLVGITWPREYGGAGLGPMEQVIVSQELARVGAPGVLDRVGVGMVGPTLIEHGTEAQKARYLPTLLRGEEMWCQLFSEPEAGSDLAGVRTRAVQAEDGSWIVNGQKMWTTHAHLASFGLLLARTDLDVPKHHGLTMLIVPMDAPGITVRGLRTISGREDFNEVFLDDAAIAADSVVGAVGDGWRVALTTLMNERLLIGLIGEQRSVSAEILAEALATDAIALNDRDVLRRAGDIVANLLAVRFASYRALSGLQDGRQPGVETGLAKVTSVQAVAEAVELVLDVLGPDGLGEGDWSHWLSELPGLRTGGGTDEVLRNTIGDRVLGLPAEPRLDKDVTFRELLARQDGVPA